ncbi:MAG: hypothetical protein NTU84_10490 [Verrucomicrobia bacterium]|nr:hypothetical protein [Verrucomicrobiota bacterium]
MFEHVRCIVEPEAGLRPITHETDSFHPFEGFSLDEKFDEFLLQLLEHPNQYMRSRVASVIFWLAQNGGLGIESIFRYVIVPGPRYGREIGTGVLHALFLSDETRFQGLAEIIPYVSRMLSDASFAVRHGGREIARIIGVSSASTGPAPLPTPKPELNTERDWADEETAILKCSDSKSAARQAEQVLEEICEECTPEETFSLWKTRQAGFGCSRVDFFSTPWEREAVFRAVGDVQDVARHNSLLECLMYNPFWPEASFPSTQQFSAKQFLERLAASDFTRAFMEGPEKIILHFHEVRHDPSTRSTINVEAISFLKVPMFFNGSFDPKHVFKRRSVHGQAVREVATGQIASVSEGAVVLFDEMFRVGGFMTPAEPSQKLLDVTRLSARSFERRCWQDGRNWDPWGVGPPRAQGCLTIMEGTGSLRASGYDLAWAVFVDGRLQRVVDANGRSFFRRGQ